MTQLTFNLPDANDVTLTPSVTTVTADPGSTYLVTAQPRQSYQVRMVSNQGDDSDWVAGPLTREFTVTDADLLVNVLVEPIPYASESETPVTLLRAYTGEIVPVGGTQADTMFTDVFYGSVYDQFGNNLLRAAAHVWLMKAAEFARLIDLDESGATRKLTQRYKQAKDMYGTFIDAADKLDETGAGVVRVGTRVVNLRADDDRGWRVLGEYIGSDSQLIGDNVIIDMVPGGVITP